MFKLWGKKAYNEVKNILSQFTLYMEEIVVNMRERLQTYCYQKNIEIEHILLNEAPEFNISFIQICNNEYFRKLIFMKEYEMITKFRQLRFERCYGYYFFFF